MFTFLVDRVQYGGCVFHDLQNKVNNHECIRENTHFKSYVIFLILYLNILTTLLNKNTRSCLLFFIKMNKVEKKIDIILERLERIEKSTNDRLDLIEKKLSRMCQIENNIAVIEKNVEGVVKSQSFLSDQYENQKKTMDNLMKKNIKLEQEMNVVLQDNTKKIKKIEVLENEINHLEQYGRWDMLTLKGIPKQAGESTDDVIINVANMLEVDLSVRDIDISHRTSNNTDAGIIIKFNSRRKRNEIYGKRKNLKNKTVKELGFNSDNKIYINESLTQKNGDLLKKTRKLKESKQLKHIWTKNGSIFVRETDDAETYNIKSITDILEYANKLQPLPLQEP